MSYFQLPMEKEDRLSPQQRAISAAEMCVAIFIVIAHNVFHWIPNEVPILFVLAILSFRLREGTWGFSLHARPASWKWTWLLVVACVALLLVRDEIVERIGAAMHADAQHVSSVIRSSHGLGHVFRNLLLVWVFAALGEEIGYRGYLLRRALDVFGRSGWGATIALIVASTAFGFGHFYKGANGILDSTGSGLILGGAYLLTRRLWASSLAHGLNDTLAIAFEFFGW